MCIPCQWSLSRYARPPKEHPGSDRLRAQLATGEEPFPTLQDHHVTLEISKGVRPKKPHQFEAQGITSEVWEVAKKCWRQKASKRPAVEKVLQILEKVAEPGMSAHNASIRSRRELIDFWSE